MRQTRCHGHTVVAVEDIHLAGGAHSQDVDCGQSPDGEAVQVGRQAGPGDVEAKRFGLAAVREAQVGQADVPNQVRTEDVGIGDHGLLGMEVLRSLTSRIRLKAKRILRQRLGVPEGDAAENALLGTDILVHPKIELIVVAADRRVGHVVVGPGERVACGVREREEQLEEVQRDRVLAAHREDVPRKRSPPNGLACITSGIAECATGGQRVVDNDLLPGGGVDLREVADTHAVGRHGHHVRQPLAQPKALPHGKEERLVLDYPST